MFVNSYLPCSLMAVTKISSCQTQRMNLRTFILCCHESNLSELGEITMVMNDSLVACIWSIGMIHRGRYFQIIYHQNLWKAGFSIFCLIFIYNLILTNMSCYYSWKTWYMHRERENITWPGFHFGSMSNSLSSKLFTFCLLCLSSLTPNQNFRPKGNAFTCILVSSSHFPCLRTKNNRKCRHL